MRYLTFVLVLVALLLNGCGLFVKDESKIKLELNIINSIYYNDKADFYFTGYQLLAFPDTTFNVENYGDEFFLPAGKTMNVKYIKTSPYQTFLLSEISPNGIFFRAINPIERIKIKFDKICQSFVIAHPSLTDIEIDKTLRLEQIKITPRHDGSYQITIGDKGRGCEELMKSEKNILRSKEYEMMINRYKIK